MTCTCGSPCCDFPACPARSTDRYEAVIVYNEADLAAIREAARQPLCSHERCFDGRCEWDQCIQRLEQQCADVTGNKQCILYDGHTIPHRYQVAQPSSGCLHCGCNYADHADFLSLRAALGRLVEGIGLAESLHASVLVVQINELLGLS